MAGVGRAGLVLGVRRPCELGLHSTFAFDQQRAV